jgi:hypothetical protein
MCWKKPSIPVVVSKAKLRRLSTVGSIILYKTEEEAAYEGGLSFEQLPDYLKKYWPTIREQLLSGTYKPQPVKRV